MPAEDVEVEVLDGLRAIAAAVDSQAVACFRDALFFRHPSGYKEQVAGQRLVGGGQAIHRGDMLFGDEHIVHRRHRMYIAEGEEIIIAI